MAFVGLYKLHKLREVVDIIRDLTYYLVCNTHGGYI